MQHSFKCVKEGCGNPAEFALKLEMKTADEKFTGTGYLDIHVCQEHKFNEEQITDLFEQTWPKFAAGFANMNMPVPDLAKTSHAWVPIEEELEFYGLLPEGTKKAWIQ